MPQEYIIDRETGRKELGGVYVEKPPEDISIVIKEKKISMGLPIGYHPFYLYKTISDNAMYYLTLRQDNGLTQDEEILLYQGLESPYFKGTVFLHTASILDYRIADSKKAGGWGYLGAIFLAELSFDNAFSGKREKILREEIAKYAGVMLEQSGKVIHREPPDKITLIQGKKKRTLEQLF